jgi:hypothetical protein
MGCSAIYAINTFSTSDKPDCVLGVQDMEVALQPGLAASINVVNKNKEKQNEQGAHITRPISQCT